MRAIWSITKREVHSFFVLPIAYVVLTVWLLYFGITFSMIASWFSGQMSSGRGDGLISALFGETMLFYLPLLVFAPVLTMRLLAEEKGTGTIEPLMTAPVNEWSIALGKYLAALVFWASLWLPMLLYFWILSGFGDEAVDPGIIGSIYLGLLCVGLLYMALGLLMSAVASSQIGAALLTFLALVTLFLVGLLRYVTQDEAIQTFFDYVGAWSQMSTFAKGIVDTRYVVFDVSLASLSLFLTVRVLQAARWR